MSEQQQQHHLGTTPVNVAISALQRQVEQLTRIINKSDTLPTNQNEGNNDELHQEIKALRTANEKAEYRIKMLLRTLEEKDKK